MMVTKGRVRVEPGPRFDGRTTPPIREGLKNGDQYCFPQVFHCETMVDHELSPQHDTRIFIPSGFQRHAESHSARRCQTCWLLGT